jgi:hypothetical protein
MFVRGNMQESVCGDREREEYRNVSEGMCVTVVKAECKNVSVYECEERKCMCEGEKNIIESVNRYACIKEINKNKD